MRTEVMGLLFNRYFGRVNVFKNTFFFLQAVMNALTLPPHPHLHRGRFFTFDLKRSVGRGGPTPNPSGGGEEGEEGGVYSYLLYKKVHFFENF